MMMNMLMMTMIEFRNCGKGTHRLRMFRLTKQASSLTLLSNDWPRFPHHHHHQVEERWLVFFFLALLYLWKIHDACSPLLLLPFHVSLVMWYSSADRAPTGDRGDDNGYHGRKEQNQEFGSQYYTSGHSLKYKRLN
jgi:hypothetical protein